MVYRPLKRRIKKNSNGAELGSVWLGAIGWGSMLRSAALTVSEAQPRWYVVQTQANREFAAAQHLAAQGFKTFLPLVVKTTRHARLFRTARAPLFPGYLFVAIAIGHDRWRSIQGTVGVARLIMGGELPKPVSTGIVEQLLAMADCGAVVSSKRALQVGQRARVLAGPLAGHIGSLTNLSADGRVRILLEIMGSHVSVSTGWELLATVA